MADALAGNVPNLTHNTSKKRTRRSIENVDAEYQEFSSFGLLSW